MELEVEPAAIDAEANSNSQVCEWLACCVDEPDTHIFSSFIAIKGS